MCGSGQDPFYTCDWLQLPCCLFHETRSCHVFSFRTEKCYAISLWPHVFRCEIPCHYIFYNVSSLSDCFLRFFSFPLDFRSLIMMLLGFILCWIHSASWISRLLSFSVWKVSTITSSGTPMMQMLDICYINP